MVKTASFIAALESLGLTSTQVESIKASIFSSSFNVEAKLLIDYQNRVLDESNDLAWRAVVKRTEWGSKNTKEEDERNVENVVKERKARCKVLFGNKDEESYKEAVRLCLIPHEISVQTMLEMDGYRTLDVYDQPEIWGLVNRFAARKNKFGISTIGEDYFQKNYISNYKTAGIFELKQKCERLFSIKKPFDSDYRLSDEYKLASGICLPTVKIKSFFNNIDPFSGVDWSSKSNDYKTPSFISNSTSINATDLEQACKKALDHHVLPILEKDYVEDFKKRCTNIGQNASPSKSRRKRSLDSSQDTIEDIFSSSVTAKQVFDKEVEKGNYIWLKDGEKVTLKFHDGDRLVSSAKLRRILVRQRWWGYGETLEEEDKLLRRKEKEYKKFCNEELNRPLKDNLDYRHVSERCLFTTKPTLQMLLELDGFTVADMYDSKAAEPWGIVNRFAARKNSNGRIELGDTYFQKEFINYYNTRDVITLQQKCKALFKHRIDLSSNYSESSEYKLAKAVCLPTTKVEDIAKVEKNREIDNSKSFSIKLVNGKPNKTFTCKDARGENVLPFLERDIVDAFEKYCIVEKKR